MRFIAAVIVAVVVVVAVPPVLCLPFSLFDIESLHEASTRRHASSTLIHSSQYHSSSSTPTATIHTSLPILSPTPFPIVPFPIATDNTNPSSPPSLSSQPSQGLLPSPDPPKIRTASDSHARESNQWKIIGLAVVCVTGIALVTLSIACFDSWTKFMGGICCCGKKEDLGEEDFIADSGEKRDWHNKLALEDGHRYPAWGSQESVAGDIRPGPPPPPPPVFSGYEHSTSRYNPYSGYTS